MGFGQPSLREGVPAWPGQPVPLTAAAQRLTPVPYDRLAKHAEQAAIAEHRRVAVVPQQHAAQPGSLWRDGPVQTLPQGGCHLLQFLA